VTGAPSPIGARAGTRQAKNLPALVTLFCGIASWVPLIVVITGPLTFLFAGLAVLNARRRAERRQLNLAAWGVALTFGAVAVQGGFTVLAGALGWIGRGLGMPIGG
jgi:hypothetical protein